MEWLKTYLKDYVAEDKLDEAVETFKKDVFPKNAIGKDKFNELNEELKLTKSQLDEKNKTIDELSKEAGSVDEYKQRIDELTEKNKTIEEEYQSKVSNITKKSELEKLLLNNNAHKDSVDLLIGKYLDDVELEDGQVKGADDLIGKIKEERSGLFLEKKEDSQDKGEKHQSSQPVDPFLQGLKGGN